MLEKKYSGRGSFETACTEFKSDNNRIDTIRVFYPAELADNNRSYPMIVSVNASGTRARNYMAVLDRIASWGFILVGNDDPQSGTGGTASQTLDLILNIGAVSELYGKIDKNNIGIMGSSQAVPERCVQLRILIMESCIRRYSQAVQLNSWRSIATVTFIKSFC